MKGFYEHDREEKGLVVWHKQRDCSFPAHYHVNLEIFLVRKGHYRLIVNEEEYTLTDDCLVCIDSYDIHEYKQVEKVADEDSCVIIIPYSYLRKFNLRKQDRQIENKLLKDAALCERLMSVADEYLSSPHEAVREAAVDLFLALLLEKLTFTQEKSQGEAELMRNILVHIQKYFRVEVTRKSIARALGYTEAYVSRVFHRYLKTGISQYVNGLRLEYIDRQRRAGDTRSTLALLYEAGFTSQRTYYRCRQLKGEKQ